MEQPAWRELPAAQSSFTLVQLTDTHLRPDPELLFGRIDTWTLTLAALKEAHRFRPDAVVLTGDLADCCSDIYDDAARLLDHAAAKLGCPVITLPGNHDVPVRQAGLFNRGRAANGPGPAETVHFLGGLRIITLDSDDPGRPAGLLSAEQLDWLRDELATPAIQGTVLALHHPPVESTLPLLAGRGLASPALLRSVIAGTDVRGILCGHYHHAQSGLLGSVPVWVGPAVSYNPPPPGSADAGDSSWISVIRLGPDSFSAAPVLVGAGMPAGMAGNPSAQAFGLPPVQGEPIASPF
ncbi:metallophosphoesterase family protein [Arthrobacter crystallopoietes]|uniref:metallophosphoesterase family protein n=1 Tax=Crystallibacter crystallopoietes TaxID=37928 RepID=UPI001486F8FA|nr:metallophosphoesterase [Arthrobacter crystallopoietes]